MRRHSLLTTVFLLLVVTLAFGCQAHSHDAAATAVPTDTSASAHDHGSMAAAAPTVASKPHSGTTVSFASAPGNGSGYLALPSGGGKHPAVIVIQEWWGVNDWVKDQADRFAKQGYVALAVDLYRGSVATDANMAHELMRGMPEDRAVNDLKGGFQYLAGRNDVDAAHIGSIGWCMGGGYSLALAINEPRLAACVINYGRLVTDPATITRIHAPILGNFGGQDRGIPPESVKTFDAALKQAGKQSDIKIYDNAGHAFMNENNKEGYVPDSAADAWQRVDAFLAKSLR